MTAPVASPWASLPVLVDALGQGAMSALELVEEALACVREHASLNAFVTLHRASARRRARELDGEASHWGGQRGPGNGGPGNGGFGNGGPGNGGPGNGGPGNGGPGNGGPGNGGPWAPSDVTCSLRGIPVAIKDNIDEAGVVCSGGCRAYDDRVPVRDAEVVARLRGAGAVILGRTNLHELANGVTSENPWRGSVVHPLNPGYHPGGSSGGSAVAVAAGCVPVALGTDTGGSVRIPAALSGVVGYKPTRGRIPTSGCMPLSTSLDHVGILASSVTDVAWVYRVLSDPAPVETVGPRCAAPGRPLRLGVLSGEAFGLPADEGVEARFKEALGKLRAAGHQLVPLAPEGLQRGISLLSAIYPPEAAAYHRERLETRPEGFSEEVRRDLLRGLRPGAKERRLAGLEESWALGERLAACFAAEDLELLLSPTTPHPARPIGSPAPHTYLTYTCVFNLTGWPALSVPMGSVGGLPVGLQMAAPPMWDERLLRLAGELAGELAGQLRQ